MRAGANASAQEGETPMSALTEDSYDSSAHRIPKSTVAVEKGSAYPKGKKANRPAILHPTSNDILRAAEVRRIATLETISFGTRLESCARSTVTLVCQVFAAFFVQSINLY